MGQVKCEITTSSNSDGFTVEVRSKDGKIYQKRTSFMRIPLLDPRYTYDKAIIKANNNERPLSVLIYVDYGDVITATRGYGYIYLKDEGADEFTGKTHSLSVKPTPSDNRQVKEVKVTKENVRVPPHKFTEPAPKVRKEYGKSVWDA
jgi:hypothetical protein